jgi:hypothetical protein
LTLDIYSCYDKYWLNKSWSDAAFRNFFKTLDYIASKAGAVVISKHPAKVGCSGSNAKKLGDKSYPFEAEGRRQKAGGNKR